MWLVGRSGAPRTGVVVPFAAVILVVGTVFLGVLTAENYVAAWARWNYRDTKASRSGRSTGI